MYPYEFYQSYDIPYNMPNMYGNTGSVLGKVGLFSRIRNGFNWNSFLNNTSRTLNIINQAIPVVNQVRPLMSNMRTMLKIASIMKEDNKKSTNNINYQNKNNYQNNNSYNDSQPTFFL